ncbi:MAG: hypothetical protein HOV68_16640 [Streptomycetaceae bacterium]|nr:hypothetical protein [Streptomycetaceae bacterium]
MRIRAGLALGMLLLVGTMSGCGGGGGDDDSGVASVGSGKPAASASASGGSGGGSGTAFAKCMRENGVPEFPDPEANGSMMLPDGVDKNKVDAAMQKCKDKMPNGGERPKMSAEDQEKQRQFAQCMRQNGIADFPDPSADGSGMLAQDGRIDPEDPKFKAAQDKCRQYMPGGPGGQGGATAGGKK